MKKLGWYAVSAAVAAFILCGGLLLAANLYVQSRPVQHRIRQALAASLRMPVSLKKTTFSPWDGLRIDGMTARLAQKPVAAGDGTVYYNELTARSFRVHFALAALLQRGFEVEDVLLDAPRLSWAQDRDNRWRLPSEKSVGTPKRERETLPPVDLPGSADIPPVNPPPSGPMPQPVPVEETPPVDQPPLPSTRQLTVDKFRLRHGSMEFLNHRRGLLGHFDDVNVDGRLVGVDRAVGQASFERAALPRAGIKLVGFRSGFAYDRGEGLTLSNATAGFAGGAVNANCHVRTGETGTPYDLQCRMGNVSIDQMIREAGGSQGLLQGRLQGILDASGFTDDPEHQSATGEFNLADAQVRDFPLFQTIGSMLQIDDLQHLQFKTARVVYRIEGSTVRIEPLTLVSNNLQITAQGLYHVREDRLDLHARLVIDQAISRQLPRIVEQQFRRSDDVPGGRYLDFDVTGPVGKPNSNLYQRVLPNAIDSLLDGFLRRGPKKKKEKTPRPVPQASSAPATPADI